MYFAFSIYLYTFLYESQPNVIDLSKEVDLDAYQTVTAAALR